jgi:hypothetical protein
VEDFLDPSVTDAEIRKAMEDMEDDPLMRAFSTPVTREALDITVGPCRPLKVKDMKKAPTPPAPKWTLVYNTSDPRSRWLGIAWEFFDEEDIAEERYRELSAAGRNPTKRPYHRGRDRQELGSVHLQNGEG